MLSLTMSTPFPGTGTPRFRPAVTPFVPQCTHTTEHRQNSRVECCRPQATKPRGVRRQRVGRQPASANHRTRPHGPWRTIGHATVPATPAATTVRPARPIARPHPSLGRPAGLMAPVTILCQLPLQLPTSHAAPRNNNQFCRRTRCRRGHMLHPALRHSLIASNSTCNSTPSTSTGRPRPHLGSRDS